MPFVIRWPGHVPAGKVEDRSIITLDVLPTALSAAQATRPADGKPLDGKDLLPFMRGEDAGTIHESLFWRFGPRNAVRSGPWKMQWNGNDPRKLYDLAADPRETTDLAAKRPDVAKKMSADWDAWNATLARPLWPGRLEGGGNAGDGLGPATTAESTTRPSE